MRHIHANRKEAGQQRAYAVGTGLYVCHKRQHIFGRSFVQMRSTQFTSSGDLSRKSDTFFIVKWAPGAASSWTGWPRTGFLPEFWRFGLGRLPRERVFTLFLGESFSSGRILRFQTFHPLLYVARPFYVSSSAGHS